MSNFACTERVSEGKRKVFVNKVDSTILEHTSKLPSYSSIVCDSIIHHSIMRQFCKIRFWLFSTPLLHPPILPHYHLCFFYNLVVRKTRFYPNFNKIALLTFHCLKKDAGTQAHYRSTTPSIIRPESWVMTENRGIPNLIVDIQNFIGKNDNDYIQIFFLKNTTIKHFHDTFQFSPNYSPFDYPPLHCHNAKLSCIVFLTM